MQQPGSKGSGQAQPGSGHGGSGVAARGKGSREAPWETGNRPDHPVAVIIVPVIASAPLRLPYAPCATFTVEIDM